MAGEDRQPYHGVLVDADQAAGLPHAATLLEVLEDGKSFGLGKFGAIQEGAFAFGEALLASPTGQDAAVLVGAVAEADAEVVKAAAAVIGAVRVLAAEGFQVIHGGSPVVSGREKVAKQRESA